MSKPIEEWIKQAKKGDKGAFKQLYNTHAAKVYSLAYRMLADASHAEDACQEVFVKVWHQLASFRGESLFSTWLHRIAVNTVIDLGRKLKPITLLDDEAPALDESATKADLEMTELESSIFRLPEQARKVFVLFALEGYQHNEIAALLGIAEGSSKAHYHRARQLLKEWLSDE